MRIGFANGCFDDFHDGHERFIRAAFSHCDWLVIAVNTDASVWQLKGDGRPRRTLKCRLLDVQCQGVSAVPFSGNPSPLIRALKPDVLIRGWDQKEERGGFRGELVRIARFGEISTTSKCNF